MKLTVARLLVVYGSDMTLLDRRLDTPLVESRFTNSAAHQSIVNFSKNSCAVIESVWTSRLYQATAPELFVC